MFLTSCHDEKSDSSKAEFAKTNLVLVPASKVASPTGLVQLPNNKPIDSIPSQLPINQENPLLQDALRLDSQGHFDSALEKVNSAFQDDPKNLTAYSIRGKIYSEMKLWDQARKEYETILQIDHKNSIAKFNLIELKFMQKAYDDARLGFVALEQDPDWGDLAAYRVFLCDLFGGHEDAAQGELDAFNKVGANPSFYFANAAWYLYHKRPEDARSWLNSAARIYAPRKVFLYSSSLRELGYLPLPPPTN
jgi:tetratricopeptide (TPR) repeat protein